MKLELLATEKDFLLLRCSESITLADVFGQNPLERLLGGDCFGNKLLLDLDKTSYIDTSAISWFIQTHKRCNAAGGCFVLHSIPPMVTQILELLRMKEVLHIASDETEARTMAQGAKP